MPIILAENWKPATKAEQGFSLLIVFNLVVLQSLVALVNDPEPEHAIRTDVAEEYMKNKDLFLKHAEECCRSNALPRE